MIGKDSKLLRSFLRDAGFNGQFNQAQYEYLVDQGYSGQLNEMWFDYLTSLGYLQKTLPEKMQAWFNEDLAVVEGAWILATGTWNDSGVWDDAESWQDS